MKKTVAILLAASLTAALGVAAVGCEEESACKHVWGTGEQAAICTICGEDRSAQGDVKTTVTEAEWKALFDAKNVTMKMQMYDQAGVALTANSVNVSGANMPTSMEGKFTENAIEQTMSTGLHIYYAANENVWFALTAVNGVWYGMPQGEQSLAIMLNWVEYADKFEEAEYDAVKKAYLMDMDMLYSGESTPDDVLSEVELYIENARLVKMVQKLNEYVCITSFTAYGTTVVENVPEYETFGNN